MDIVSLAGACARRHAPRWLREDAIQEALIEVIRVEHDYQPNRKVTRSAFLYMKMRYRILEWTRTTRWQKRSKHADRGEVLSIDLTEVPDIFIPTQIEAGYEEFEKRESYGLAVQILKDCMRPRDFEILREYYLEGEITLMGIALRDGMTESGVSYRLKYARTKALEIFREHGIDRTILGD